VIAVEGTLAGLDAAALARLLDRGRATDPAVARAVAGIIGRVRDDGDAALAALAAELDGVSHLAMEVPREACDRALATLDPAVRAALELAAGAIDTFHRAQLPAPLELETHAGVRLGRRAEPLRRVGVYAPGGRAAYPSSVLMGVIPARVAQVGEVVVCSPPGPDGRPPAAVLAACALAGADRVFALGGAGAIAALAYGTATVPRVDKVVGPGNAYVTEAKRQLTGVIAIDSPAGPSEVLVLADDQADPELIAAELLAQAEHDPDAAAVLVAAGPGARRVAAETRAALERLLPAMPRRQVIEAALAARGALLVADGIDEAVAFAERYAPEHLLVLTAQPRALLPRLRAAGTIFLGAASSVAFGDYTTGANHVLPTAGLARAYAGLDTGDFLRWVTWQELSASAAAELAGPTATLATAEGLPAHAHAARLRGTPAVGAGAVPAAHAPGRASARPPTRGRAAYREIELYEPGRQPVELDLSDNTNLLGPPPAALAALAAVTPDEVSRYPTVFADRLKQALAERHGVAPENVATGAGSDDVIDSAVRAFCEAGDVVAYPWPTFGVVPTFARMNAARPVAVPLGAGFAPDAGALLATGARVTYLCSPNNPTGNLFPPGAVARLAAEAAGVVLLDEAYADFAGGAEAGAAAAEADPAAAPDYPRLAAASERLVVLRTFSKVFGLAGLRVGYAIGPAALIREIEKSRGPYKVGRAAEAAALAALAERAWLGDAVALLRRNRSRLAAALAALGFRVFPSDANFLLVQVRAGAGAHSLSDATAGEPAHAAAGAPPQGTAPDALRFAAALRDRGIGVRAFPALPAAGECVRITIGPWPAMERLLDAVRDIMRGTAV
jgi:histidinol dehydrogenase